MSVFCNPSCVPTAIPTFATSCNLSEHLLKGGINKIVAIKCTATLTDVTDSVEWAALKTSSDVFILPVGKSEFTEPTADELEIDACGTKVFVNQKKAFEFTSKLMGTGASDGVQHDIVDVLNKSGLSYRYAFIDCNGRLYYSYAWTTGNNPAFAPNSVKAYVATENNYLSLKAKLELDYTDGQENSFKMSQALAAVLA